MKTTFALTALSTKLAMLLCVSCMGFMGMVQESMAAQPSPCHQEVAQEDEAKEPCEMCETALEAWEENAVTSVENVLVKVTDIQFATESLVQSFDVELKPLAGVYEAYYPPPDVVYKAVTPTTKTIVLLV